MKTIITISIFTLITLLSFNFQNYRLQVKLKSNYPVVETEVVQVLSSKLTNIVLAFIEPAESIQTSFTPTLVILVSENPTVNQLYLALPPPSLS